MFIGKQIFKVITRNNLSQVEYILSLYKLKLKLCLFHSTYTFKKRGHATLYGRKSLKVIGVIKSVNRTIQGTI